MLVAWKNEAEREARNEEIRKLRQDAVEAERKSNRGSHDGPNQSTAGPLEKPVPRPKPEGDNSKSDDDDDSGC
jgi:hypothetical protein